MIKAQLGSKLPTAPKAEIRYQNGVKDSVAYLGVPFKDSSYFGESIKRVKTPENASIERRILFRHYPYDNDTTYTEIPEHSKYKIYPIKTKVQPRQASNSDVKYVKRNKDGFISYIPTTPSDEYATLKRRFDTAWGIAKHEEGSKIKRIPFNLDPRITYKTPEFVPTYNKTVPEVNVISAKLPGVEVTAPDLSKALRFPYGGVNVVSKSINGGLDRKQRTFVNPFEGHDLVASKLEGGPIEKADNTRVASGRPQQVLNKIPYGAGKGPAGEGPMRLFNDPYVNMGLMAMAPMAVKIQSRNALVPTQSILSPSVHTNQSYGLLRLYRAAQLKGYKGTVEDFIALSSEILGIPQATGPEGSKFYGYNLERGNNVLYSRSNPENPKVEGLTVNEPARWQELLKKIIK